MSGDDKKLGKGSTIDPNLDGDWKAPERSLDADGRVTGGAPRPPPKAPSQAVPLEPH
jgi:hypothetical protein